MPGASTPLGRWGLNWGQGPEFAEECNQVGNILARQVFLDSFGHERLSRARHLGDVGPSYETYLILTGCRLLASRLPPVLFQRVSGRLGPKLGPRVHHPNPLSRLGNGSMFSQLERNSYFRWK